MTFEYSYLKGTSIFPLPRLMEHCGRRTKKNVGATGLEEFCVAIIFWTYMEVAFMKTQRHSYQHETKPISIPPQIRTRSKFPTSP